MRLYSLIYICESFFDFTRNIGGLMHDDLNASAKLFALLVKFQFMNFFERRRSQKRFNKDVYNSLSLNHILAPQNLYQLIQH